MKTNCWLLVGTMLSTSLLAQSVTNAPPAAPMEPAAAAPEATNAAPAPAAMSAPAAESAPTSKSAKKKSAKKKSDKKGSAKKKDAAAQLKTVPLIAGPATAAANNVNVRGQPKVKSEVIGRLTNGEPVTVIEEIVRNDSGPDEPSAWAKIALPSGAHTWVNSAFIEASTKTVKARKLNVRSGPGENFSVLGQLQKGEAVKDVTTKGDWIEIEAPAAVYAFVAAQYLKQEGGGGTQVAAAKPVESSLTPTNVSEAPMVATNITETLPPPGTNETSGLTNLVSETGETNVPPAPPEPPPKRIVSHEGIVKGTVSIQAPTAFALVSPDNGRLIDYLYTDSPGLDLRRYKGMRVVVTGEEGIEERWPNTPVITIQNLVLSDAAGESN